MIVVRDHDFGISRGVPHGLVENRDQQNEENQCRSEPGELLVGRARRLDYHGASLVRRAAGVTPVPELSTKGSALGAEAASVDNPEGMAGADEEVKAISETARDLALRQLDQQFQASDNLDTKALGVLALDVAALAAILAGAKDVFQGRNWGYPAALILLSAVLAMIAISTRRWSYGPKVAAFYGKATHDPTKVSAAQANADLISELVDTKIGAVAKAEAALRWKARLFEAAMGLVVIAGLVSVIILR